MQQLANLSLFRTGAHPVNRAPRAPGPRSDCDAPSTRCIPPIPLTAVSPESFHPFTRETAVTSPPEKFIRTPGRERTNNQKLTIRTRELLVPACVCLRGLFSPGMTRTPVCLIPEVLPVEGAFTTKSMTSHPGDSHYEHYRSPRYRCHHRAFLGFAHALPTTASLPPLRPR